MDGWLGIISTNKCYCVLQKTVELLIAVCSDGMKSHPHVIAIICLQTTFFRSSQRQQNNLSTTSD